MAMSLPAKEMKLGKRLIVACDGRVPLSKPFMALEREVRY